MASTSFTSAGEKPNWASKLLRAHWVHPEVVVDVTYLTWTEGGLLRAVVSGAAAGQAGAGGRSVYPASTEAECVVDGELRMACPLTPSRSAQTGRPAPPFNRVAACIKKRATALDYFCHCRS